MKVWPSLVVLAGWAMLAPSVWAQDAQDAPDAVDAMPRKPIDVSAEQRAFVLQEMRAFLEATQDVLLAVADNDMGAVADVARTMAPSKASADMGINHVMPQEFRELGQSTHQAFADLAQSAQFGSNAVVADLGNLMTNCTNCHAAFRLVVKP